MKKLPDERLKVCLKDVGVFQLKERVRPAKNVHERAVMLRFVREFREQTVIYKQIDEYLNLMIVLLMEARIVRGFIRR